MTTQQSFSRERGEKQFAVEKALFLQLVPAQIEENKKLLRANKLLFLSSITPITEKAIIKINVCIKILALLKTVRTSPIMG